MVTDGNLPLSWGSAAAQALGAALLVAILGPLICLALALPSTAIYALFDPGLSSLKGFFFVSVMYGTIYGAIGSFIIGFPTTLLLRRGGVRSSIVYGTIGGFVTTLLMAPGLFHPRVPIEYRLFCFDIVVHGACFALAFWWVCRNWPAGQSAAIASANPDMSATVE